jgi:large subunit ribosomal protein L25
MTEGGISMSATIHAERRELTTRGELRKIREAGKVPGVIYGKGLESPALIAVEAKKLLSLLRSNPHAVVDMEVPGFGTKPVMMTEVQRDAINQQLLHIDFRQIDMNQKIKVPTRLEVVGKSPGEKEGGMLQLILHELELECYPKDLPDSIPMDVSSLQVGDHLTVGELKLPNGVTTTLDPEAIVLAILAPQKERSEDEIDELDDAAEENMNHAKAAMAVEKD